MNLVCAEAFRRLMILRRRLTSRRQARYGIAFSLELLVRVRALDATSPTRPVHQLGCPSADPPRVETIELVLLQGPDPIIGDFWRQTSGARKELLNKLIAGAGLFAQSQNFQSYSVPASRPYFSVRKDLN